MNIAAQLLAYYKSPAAQNETLEVLREGGEILFRPRGRTETFSNMEEAQRYAKEILGLREVWDTAGGQLRGSPFMQEFRRALATETQNNNLRMTEEVYDLQSTSQMEEYNARRFKDGVAHGFQVNDGNRVRLVRFIPGDDPAGMTEAEIRQGMRKHMGFNFHGLDDGEIVEHLFDGKYNKRARAVVARKQIEAAKWGSPITVSIVDARPDMHGFISRVTSELENDKGALADALREIGVEGDEADRILANWDGNRRGVSARIASLLAEEKGHQAVDGISRASSHFFERTKNAQQEMMERLIKEAQQAKDSGDLLNLRKINQSIKKLNDNMLYLDDALEHRRNFNVRAMGLDMLLDDAEVVNKWFSDIDLDEGVQLKGDIFWDARLDKVNAERARKGLPPIDIETHYKNITNEGGSILRGATKGTRGRIAKALDGKASYWTLTPYTTIKSHIDQATGTVTRGVPEYGLKGTQFDVQTMSSMPEIMNAELIDEAFATHMQRFESNISELEQGRIPGILLDMLEKQANDDSLDVIKRTRARNLLEYIHKKSELLRETEEIDPITGEKRLVREAEDILGGKTLPPNIAKDPLIRQQFINIISESTTKTRSNITMPNMDIPNTFRGYVRSANVVPGRDPGPGVVRYDKEAGSWIMHGPDAPNVYAAFGGFDSDDALNGMIRVDPDGNLKVVMFRQPNARGEWQLFDIAHDDPAVAEAVRRRSGVIQDATFMDKYQNTINDIKRSSNPAERARAQRQMQRLFTQSGMDIFDLHDPRQAIPMRYGWRQMEAIEEGGQRVIRHQGEPEFMRYLATGAEDIPKQHFRTAVQMATENLSKSIKNQHLLGTYSNARMFFDHFLAQNLEHLDDLGISMSNVLALEQETIIDAAKGMANEIDADTVDRISKRLVEQVIESAVEAHLTEGGQVVGIDPELWKYKSVGGTASRHFEDYKERLIQEGRVGAETLTKESLQYSRDDPRATIARIAGHAEKMTEVRKEALVNITYPKEFLEGNFARDIARDAQATSDAEGLLQAYRRSVARNMGDLNIGSIDDIFKAIEAGEQVVMDPMEMVHSDVLSRLTETFDRQINQATGQVEHVAGPRTFRAIVRAAQRIEAMQPDVETIKKSGRVFQQALGGLSRHGLFTATTDYVDQQTIKGLEKVSGPEKITLDYMSREAGIAYSRDQVSDVFRRILGDEEFKALALVDAAIGGRAGGVSKIGAEAARPLMEMRGSTILPAGGELMGIFDPRAAVMLEGDAPRTMGMVAMDYLSGGDEMQELIGSRLSDMAANYLDFGADYAARQDADDVVAQAFRRGLGAIDGGTDKMRIADEAAAQANKIVTNQFRRIKGTTVAKIAASVAAVGFGGAALKSATTKDDRTIEDMQGPAFLPGGNPYTHPRRVRDFDFPQYTPQQQGGITYDIRANGEVSDDLINSLQNLTGGANVVATNYM